MSYVFKFEDLVDFYKDLTNVRKPADRDAGIVANKAPNSMGNSIKDIRRNIIINFLTKYRARYEKSLPPYTLFRLLLPDSDLVRMYHLKEVSLAHLVAGIYGISKQTDEYKRLFNEELVHGFNLHYRKKERIANIMAELISFRQVTVLGGELSVKEIDECLDKLSDAKMNPTSKFSQKKVLAYLFSKMSFEEIKMLILIILKARIIGQSESLFLYIWHPDAPSYFSVVKNLKDVSTDLNDPETRLTNEQLSVQIMKPFGPQLAAHPKKNYDEIVTEFGGRFLIEEKLDGERLLMHMNASPEDPDTFNFKFYSRSATDYTSIYGKTNKDGLLAKYIAEVIGERRLKAINRLILDGEVLSYDMKRKIILPLGTLKSTNIEATFQEGSNFRPLYVLFDILMVNDKLICNSALQQRKKILNQLMSKQKHGYVEIVKSFEASTAEDIAKSLRDAIESNSEGIILKDLRAPYKIDDRHRSWIKVKPEYYQEFGADMDLCVIGKIPRKKTSYICGLRVGELKEGGATNIFISFCSISNGISFQDLEKIETLTLNKWHNFEREPPDDSVVQFGDLKPVYWIDPNESVILQVKSRNIEYGQYGKRYKVGSTILSGYMKTIRDDKNWRTAFSLEEYLNIKQLDSIKIKKRKLSKEHTVESKMLKTAKKKLNEPENKLQNVKLKSNLFENFVFYILSDFRYESKIYEVNDIATIVKQYSGRVTRNENANLFKRELLIIISSRNTSRAKFIHSKGFDVIHPSWIFDCICAREILLLEPKYCFKVSNSIMKQAEKRVDRLNDSYLNNINKFYFEEILYQCADTVCKDSGTIHKNFTYEIQQNENVLDEYNPVFSDLNVFIFPLSKLLFWRDKIYREQLSLEQLCTFEILEESIFIRQWEIQDLKDCITFEGGSITDNLMNANLIVFPNYIKHYIFKASVRNSMSYDFINLIITKFYAYLRVTIDFARKTISEKVSLQNHEIIGKVPVIVNNVYIDKSIECGALVDHKLQAFQPIISDIN